MAKTIVETHFRDFTVKESGVPVKDGDGNHIPKDPNHAEDGIIKMKGCVNGIVFYEQDRNNRYTRVEISADEVKRLHARITEVEAREFYEFYDEIPF